MPSQSLPETVDPRTGEPSRTPREGAAAPSGPGARLRWLPRQLLRMPLLAKIVVLNTVLVAGTAAVASQLRVGSAPARAYIVMVGAASVAALSLNYALVSLALTPVRALELTASRVAQGDYGARVPPSRLADAKLHALGETLNALLDRVTTDRERLRQFSSAIIGAADRERARLGRDLNDQTAQLLSALVLQLSVAPAEATPSQQRIWAELRQLASRALEDVRLHARTLYPRVLDDFGLPAALQTLATEGMAHAPGLTITVESSHELQVLPTPVASALYFVAQEAVANTIRHARARQATVRASRDAQRVALLVADDGVGFDVARALRGVGAHGIPAMRERIALLDGMTVVQSAPHTGTRVQVTIPHLSVRHA